MSTMYKSLASVVRGPVSPFLCRAMSMYNPHFVEPVFRKDQQAVLKETGEAEKLVHVRVKAARNNETSSVFFDDRVRKFTNYIMKGGRKELARDLLFKCFENIKRIQLERYNLATAEEKDKIKTNPVDIFYDAVENCRPLLQLTPIKRGGQWYQVPVPVTDNRSYFLSMKWILEAAKDKERRVHLPEKLAWELLDAASYQGRVIKRKQDLHRQCEANRAYAHYRWS
ncbi:small ribosomal subunit protein uS7m [Phlebotomus argentipes]|uniref:small ribosomal subunit protein uS7m n=1 Tax=Phlebotomus argentipes TaxID=94469 RepID=UPI002892CB79|nr:small ribosomal subunit protein uS7m [Phlebotomus argentipes]